MQKTSVNAAQNPSVPRTETGNIKLSGCHRCGGPQPTVDCDRCWARTIGKDMAQSIRDEITLYGKL